MVRPVMPTRYAGGFVRMWSSAADAPRKRRPTDILLLVASVVMLGVLSLGAPGPTGGDRALGTLLTWLEPVFGWLWNVIYAVLTLWAVGVVLLALLSRGRRRLLVDQVAAAGVAFGAAVAVGAVAGTDPSAIVRAFVSSGPPVVYIATRVAVITAIVVTASPHLARPWRYASRIVLGLGAVAAVGLQATNLLGAIAAVAVGVAAAAVVHLAFGSPPGRLTDSQAQAALLDLGVPTSLVVSSADRAGADNLLAGRTLDGADVLVTVYGRDAWDSQVVGSLWTAITRRGERAHVWGTRRSRVEHEALLTLLASQAGVPTLDVVAVGITEQGDALLVTSAPSTSLSAVGMELSDAQLDGAWRSVVALNQAGIAHGGIDGTRVVLRADGVVALADFDGAARTADTGELLLDRAQLLVATALAVGPDRAITAALAALGTDGLTDVLPYLQPAAVGRSTRADVRAASWSLDDLRTAAVAAAGTEEPPLERLRRVTPRSIGTVVVVGLVAYLVITLLTGIDVASVAAALGSAEWGWLVAALVLTPWIQVSSAAATLGAITARLRYFPVLMLQYAIQFIALVLPATAARLALEVRFFQRFGIPAGTAVTFGVIDSVSGFVVQITLMLVILLSGLPGFSSPLFAGSGTDDDGSSSPSLVALLVALVVIAAVVALAVPKLRRRIATIVPRVREAAAEQARSAQSALGVLRRPGKVATMLAGNLGVQLLQAFILGLCLHAFGQTAHFSQLILINTFVSLFSGIMPVPGGMGVTEAGLTVGLQAIGVPSAIAVSTAITFRLVTFYLPPIWGAAAMRWLRRNEYV